jgi:hypothetical protein
MKKDGTQTINHLFSETVFLLLNFLNEHGPEVDCKEIVYMYLQLANDMIEIEGKEHGREEKYQIMHSEIARKTSP